MFYILLVAFFKASNCEREHYLNCDSRSGRPSSDCSSVISCPLAAPGFDETDAGDILDEIVVEGTDVDAEELLALARVVADTELMDVDEFGKSEWIKNLDSNSSLVSSRS